MRITTRRNVFKLATAITLSVLVIYTFQIVFENDAMPTAFPVYDAMPTAFLDRFSDLREHLDNTVIYRNDTTGSASIPRIIHQVWNNDIIPTEFVNMVKGLVEHNNAPTWQYYFWTPTDARELIKDKYPEFLETFDKYPSEGTYRPDAMRYVVLYEYGGVYLDLDTVSMKPLDPFLEQHTCALVKEPMEHYPITYEYPSLLANNALFCRSRHPFYRYVIDSLPSLVTTGCLYSKNKHDCTGPNAFDWPYYKYREKYVDDLEIVPTELFNDKCDEAVSKHLLNRCSNNKRLNQFQKTACDAWTSRGGNARKLSSRAYTYHTWYHVNQTNVSFKTQNNISLVVPHARKYNKR